MDRWVRREDRDAPSIDTASRAERNSGPLRRGRLHTCQTKRDGRKTTLAELELSSYGTDKYADKLELYADKRGWHNIFAKARRAHQRALEALAA